MSTSQEGRGRGQLTIWIKNFCGAGWMNYGVINKCKYLPSTAAECCLVLPCK
jgi:hypothetical protein